MSDLINRQALIDHLKGIYKTQEQIPSIVVDEHLILPTIGNQPTVDAVPVVHGKWLPQEKSYLGKNWFIYSCSICESGAPEEGTCKTLYCPICGAKMDGERKESEVKS